MSLFCSDIDKIIASHIFGSNDKWNLELIKKVYYAFGKSTYDSFVVTCQNILLELQYNKCGTTDFDVVLKKTVKGTPKFFPCYRILSTKPDQVEFENLNAKHRLMLYELALYYGYLLIVTEVKQYEKFGYAYYDFHDGCMDKVTPYHILKRKRIHNLKYYDVVTRDVRRPWKTTYRLKKDSCVYKEGVTTETKSFLCIKVI